MLAVGLISPPRTLNILFLGNSHTYINDVPVMVKALIESDGSQTKVAVKTYGAGFVEELSDHPLLRQDIQSKKWNVMVMQGARLSSSHKYKYDHTGALNLASFAKKHGLRVCFSPEWPRRGWDESAWIMNQYKGIAKPSKSEVIPVSFAWENLLKEQPKLQLWAEDGNHALLSGSYLAAATIAAWFASPTAGTPAWRPGAMNAKLASDMKRVAKQTVQKHR